jgi:hypothetical protein
MGIWGPLRGVVVALVEMAPHRNPKSPQRKILKYFQNILRGRCGGEAKG